MGRNKLKVSICGTDYYITSEEDEAYVRSVADKVEAQMNAIMEANPRVSVTMAAVLTALDSCDEGLRALSSADNLRSQIKDYLEESSKARMEADEARRENERLKRELQSLRMKLAESDLPEQKGGAAQQHQKPQQQNRDRAAQPPAPMARPVQSQGTPLPPQAKLYSRPGIPLAKESEPEDAVSFFDSREKDRR